MRFIISHFQQPNSYRPEVTLKGTRLSIEYEAHASPWLMVLMFSKKELLFLPEQRVNILPFSFPKGRSVHFVWKDQAINKTSFAKHGTERLSVNVAHAL